MNAAKKIAQLANEKGELPAYAWPGGYPLYYIDAESNVLCPECAANNDEMAPPVIEYDEHLEGAPLQCNQCSQEIESAYGDPDEETTP